MHAKLFLVGLVLAVPAARAEGDEEAAQRKQMLADCGYEKLPVKAYPGSAGVLACERRVLDRLEAPLGRNPADGSMKVERLEGDVTRFNFNWPTGVSFLQVSSHYEGALREAGFELVFAPRESDLGFVTARKGNTWVLLEPYGGGSQVSVVKAQPKKEQRASKGAAGLLEALERDGRVTVYGIDFVQGKATLSLAAEGVLSEVQRLLQDNGDLRLRVVSHTDNAGKPKESLALSKKRAAAIKAWLVKQGIAPARLEAEGLGDTRPVAENGSTEGMARNRRVELVKL
jgi:outer membrane protein OmpA-like peptidoglycan-associated protein